MVKINLLIILYFFTYLAFSNCINLVLVHFTDKGNGLNDIESEVNKQYISTINDVGFEYINSSKWFNVAIFSYEDADKIEEIKKLPFVEKIDFGCINHARLNKNYDKFQTENNSTTQQTLNTSSDTTYSQQITQLKGNYLQNLNFKGQGIKIAVIDNGFPNADNIEGLQHIYNENRLLETYNFYTNSTNVYHSSSANHGTNCFSIIGGLLPSFSGSAPKASFYLYRTEVDAIEGQTEEVLLSSALETAYDNGVQVASISLGYSNGFNDNTENHTYNSLNGKTTIAAKAVNIASSKGMLVCVAAGNEGNNSWKYLTTPADADSAFTIGAVDINQNTASFTSFQFDTATAIKPNVVALGVATQFLNSSNGISSGNGTSYATPIIAGLSACLWQAFPTKTNWEIKTAIEKSAHLYSNPDKRLGYGMPDFQKAYHLLQTENINITDVKIYPTAFSNTIYIQSKNNINKIRIFTINGKLIYEKNYNTNFIILNDVEALHNNMYLIQAHTDKSIITKKVIKQ